MKHTLYILIALMLAACTHDEPLEYDPDFAIKFQPSMYMHVSHDNVEGFTEDMDFAVRAWSLPRGARWGESSANASEYLPATVAHCKEQSAGNNSISDKLWSLSDQQLWPAAGTTLTFIGYSPASAACECNQTNGVTCTMDVAEEQTDLLYTQPCCDREKTTDGGIVPLVFEHALCRIDLRAVNRVAEGEKITIKKITIDEVLHKGTFTSLPAPQWKLDDSYKEIVLFDGTQELTSKPSAIGRYIFLPPQKLATALTVEFEYTTAMQTTIPQKQKTALMRTLLKAGRTYTYTLSVGIDEVKFLQDIINK
ncbi:MAG: fimbrillin family protein [Bacteroidaceae bacterium]|nr:fimbrillin family protein [Bacteroidaceae bacterium]